jgi:hypothetical protein
MVTNILKGTYHLHLYNQEDHHQHLYCCENLGLKFFALLMMHFKADALSSEF